MLSILNVNGAYAETANRASTKCSTRGAGDGRPPTRTLIPFCQERAWDMAQLGVAGRQNPRRT